MKKKYLVWGAIATIVGVGYYYWNKGKEERQRRKKEADDVLNATPPTESGSQANTSNLGSSSSSGAPTQAQIDLAIAYRKWANSTDALKKKWGKTSTYDLDETSAKPYNQYFLDSYNGGGKAEYEAYLKSKGSGSSGSGTITVNQAKLNKEMMDKLQFSLTGNSAVTPLSDSSGRILSLAFHKTWQSEDMRIVFFEIKSGAKKPYFYIKNDKNQKTLEGFWSYDGNTYVFDHKKGTKDVKTKGKNLLACIKLLVGGENVAFGEA